MNYWCRCVCMMVTVGIALPGCGVRPVVGGTPGVIRSDSVGLCDIQVTIHHRDGSSSHTVGFGISGSDGRFALLQNGAQGPLWLSPSEYRCTVESVGPVPLRFPKEYARPDTTPLEVSWTSHDRELHLELPPPLTSR